MYDSRRRQPFCAWQPSLQKANLVAFDGVVAEKASVTFVHPKAVQCARVSVAWSIHCKMAAPRNAQEPETSSLTSKEGVGSVLPTTSDHEVSTHANPCGAEEIMSAPTESKSVANYKGRGLIRSLVLRLMTRATWFYPTCRMKDSTMPLWTRQAQPHRPKMTSEWHSR